MTTGTLLAKQFTEKLIQQDKDDDIIQSDCSEDSELSELDELNIATTEGPSIL